MGWGKTAFCNQICSLEFLVLPFFFFACGPSSSQLNLLSLILASLKWGEYSWQVWLFVKGLPGGQGMGMLRGPGSEDLSLDFCPRGLLLAAPRATRPAPVLGAPAPRLPGFQGCGWHRCRLPARPLCPRDPRRPAGGRPWLYLHGKQPVEAGHVWTKRWQAGTSAGGGLLLIGI